MNHPDRINTEVRRGRRLAPAGWATVYTLAAFMAGVLIYIASR